MSLNTLGDKEELITPPGMRGLEYHYTCWRESELMQRNTSQAKGGDGNEHDRLEGRHQGSGPGDGGERTVVVVMVNRNLSSSMGKNVEKAVWQSRNQTGYLLLARTTLKDLMLTVSSMFKKYSQSFFFFFLVLFVPVKMQCSWLGFGLNAQ